MFGALRLVSVQQATTRASSPWSPSAGPGRCTPTRSAACLVVAGHHPPVARGAVAPTATPPPGSATSRPRTFIRRFSETSNEEVRLLAELATPEAAATLDGDGVGHDQQSVLYQVDVRYHGQGFEVLVDVDLERFRDGGLEHVGEAFDAEHTAVHLRPRHRARAGEPPGGGPGPGHPGQAEEVLAGGPDPAAAATGTTTIWVEDGERQATVYDRALLQAGNRVQGLAVVTEMDSTTLILPGHAGEVDRYGQTQAARPAPAEGS